MSLLNLFLFLLTLIAVGIAAFFAGRTSAADTERMKALEEELQQSRETLQHYRDEVNQHFDQTAGLFSNLTSSYRDLYVHLADGYEKLTNVSAQKLLPERPEPLLQRPAIHSATAAAGVASVTARDADDEPHQPSDFVPGDDLNEDIQRWTPGASVLDDRNREPAGDLPDEPQHSVAEGAASVGDDDDTTTSTASDQEATETGAEGRDDPTSTPRLQLSENEPRKPRKIREDML